MLPGLFFLDKYEWSWRRLRNKRLTRDERDNPVKIVGIPVEVILSVQRHPRPTQTTCVEWCSSSYPLVMSLIILFVVKRVLSIINPRTSIIWQYVSYVFQLWCVNNKSFALHDLPWRYCADLRCSWRCNCQRHESFRYCLLPFSLWHVALRFQAAENWESFVILMV